MHRSVSVFLAAGVLALGIGRAGPDRAGDHRRHVEGQGAGRWQGHDAVQFDTRHHRHVELQRPMRHQLAAADGAADAKPSGDWTVVTRKDGGKQWAYKGKPLYTFHKDAKPGDATGDGVNNVWHIAAP